MRRLSRSVIILLNRAQYSTVTSTAWRKFRQFGLSFGYQGCGHGATACFKTTPEPISPTPPPTHTHNFHANQTSWGLYEKLSGKQWLAHPTPQDYTLSHGFVTAGGSVFPTDNTFLHIRVVPHFLPIATKLLEGNLFTPVCQSFCSEGGWGVCLSVCWDSRPPTPPGTDPPGADSPPGADTPSTPPGADNPHRRRHPREQTPPRSRHPLGADTPRPVHAGRYGQQAGGTYPTGMHSCCKWKRKLVISCSLLPLCFALTLCRSKEMHVPRSLH